MTARETSADRPSLRECVDTEVTRYFSDLGGELPHELYAKVMEEVERALLETVLRHSEGRRCDAARWLGINRNTLSKKIQNYGLDV